MSQPLQPSAVQNKLAIPPQQPSYLLCPLGTAGSCSLWCVQSWKRVYGSRELLL